MRKNCYYFPLILLLTFILHFNLNAQVAVEKTDGEWNLLVDGKPFEAKGVTFGYDKEVGNYEYYFQDLKFLGVNTIRLWGTNKNTKQLLDAAHAHEIKVMVGIWLRHGRPGMEDDDSFDYLNDTEGMEEMYRNAIDIVETFKDHPAVLTWGVGNEVYLNTATDAEKEAYSIFLERICSAIKKLDTNHPITSVDAWTFGLDWWERFVPSIDIYGLNSYGAGANYLSAELEKREIDKPYIITEFGVTGEWDIKDEKNGIKIEPSDQQKKDAIVNGYHDWIKNKSSCLGVYIFHYANGKDFIAPWLFTHCKGMYRPQYWAIREAYTGEKAVNSVPFIEKFELPVAEVNSGTWLPITLLASDLEQEALELSFYYNQRTGSRKRRDQINPLNFRGNLKEGFEIQSPNENGAIKIYAHARDSFNNVGIASASIVVKDKEAAKRKYLVPKASLPFYVYKDNGELPYVPSGYMGNYKAMEVDLDNREDVYSGSTCIKISYTDRAGWYGLGFVDPANDWGDILGGYNITGAKTFSFWAKTNDFNVEATIGFGLIDDNKPFPDTGKKSKEIVLKNNWKKYTIKIKKSDLSCIRSGLVIFSSGKGFPHNIYIDEVVFE